MDSATTARRFVGLRARSTQSPQRVIHDGREDQQSEEFRVPAGVEVVARAQEHDVLQARPVPQQPVGEEEAREEEGKFIRVELHATISSLSRATSHGVGPRAPGDCI